MNTLAIVPARSGSKGVPGKNARMFAGAPLLAWAVHIGIETCNCTVISTDSEEYASIAMDAGADDVVMRPKELAADDTPMLDVVRHALEATKSTADVVVLLQPTSPLRTVEHVRWAVEMLAEMYADSVATVVEIPAHYLPEAAVKLSGGFGWLSPYEDAPGGKRMDDMPTRRQFCETAYSRDGSVYAIRRSTIEAGSLYGAHCFPLILSPNESANIDTEEDWQRAESLMKARLEKA